MPVISPMQGFTRLARDFTGRGKSLGRLWRQRSVWQVRLRWAVPPSIVAAVLAGRALGFEFDWAPLLAVAGCILAYNVVLGLVIGYYRPLPGRRDRTDRAFAIAQVSLDYAALLALLHFTGGVASPLLFFLIFHVIFAALLFRPSTAYVFAAAASVGAGLLGALQGARVLAVHPLSFRGHLLTPSDQVGTTLSVLVFFTAALFITAAASSMIMARLRERVVELAEATERVAMLNDKLGSLYVMVEAVSVQKALDRVVETVAEQLTKVTEVAGIAVKLLSEDGASLRYAAVHGLPASFNRDRVIELTRSPFNRRVIDGETLVLGQVEEHHAFQLRDDLIAAGIHSVILAPLRVEQRVIGVLGAYQREAHRFGEDDLGFFKLAAELVAIAIDNVRQAEAIEHLMDARTRLMLTVAHNLRAPLAAATSMLETVAGGYLGTVSDKQRDYLDRVERRLCAMRTTITELLTLARARQQDPGAGRGPVILQRVVTEVEQTFRAEAERKGLELRVALGEHLPEIRGNADLLQQLVENLLSNAIKYTPPGGRVDMTLDKTNGSLLALEVRDTGIGIPEDEQARLFTEFFRASNARKLEEAGTGLGLPIVKRIIEIHGGEIHIESQEGKGTKITVTLPVPPAQVPSPSSSPPPDEPPGSSDLTGDAHVAAPA